MAEEATSMAVAAAVEEPAAEAEEAPEASPKKDEKAAPAQEARKSGRERKARQVYKPVEKEVEIKALVVPDGCGEAFGDIENISLRLKDIKAVDPLLKKVHTLLFPGQRGVKANIKKNIRLFKGFAKENDDETRERCDKLLSACEVGKVLKPMCQLFDVEVSGAKDDLVVRIIDFLFEPVSSGKEFKKGTKRKASTKKKSTKKKKGKKEDKPKRAPSAFMVFSNANRAQVKEDNPDATFGELAKITGKMWRELDDDEKEEWKEKASSGASASPKKKKAKTAPKKKKKKKEESEEEEEDSDDEDTPLAPGLGSKIESKIREILAATDLADLTIKKIKVQLKADFGEELIASKRKEIKEFVEKAVQES